MEEKFIPGTELKAGDRVLLAIKQQLPDQTDANGNPVIITIPVESLCLEVSPSGEFRKMHTKGQGQDVEEWVPAQALTILERLS